MLVSNKAVQLWGPGSQGAGQTDEQTVTEIRFHPFWRVVGFVPQSSLLFELAGYKPPKGTAHSSVSSPSKPTKLDLTCMAPLIWPTDHQTTGESPLSSLQSSSPSNFSSSSNSQVVTSNVESSLGTSLFPTSPAVPQTTGQLPRDREWFISTPRPTQIGLDSAVSNLSFQGHQGLEISRFSGYAANYLRLHAHDLISQKGDFSRFCEALKNDELVCAILPSNYIAENSLTD
ncbi:unnamed protein product [Protopolystoma xenopodis]|uniref:Uncharacterized protein n=1 Tax=Protopolystoma xenopodis TaxID=117903 RepID=A0A3S5C7E7_9PLAT|nr:unnamed protein product [Protopolystoma xenopodis]